MELIIEKLRKVRELAERGEAGEALVAREKLHMLLNKYGLTIQDLEDVKVSRYKFKYVTSAEKDIILQCLSKVMDNPRMTYSWYKDKKKEFFVEMTDWQYVESKILVDFHIKQFRKELKAQMKALVSAYATKHDLFSKTKSDEPGKEMTPEEMARLIAIYQSLGDKFFQKQLVESK
jgi:hypothetical protein